MFDIIGDVISDLVGGVFEAAASSIRRRVGVLGCIVLVLLIVGLIAGLIWWALG